MDHITDHGHGIMVQITNMDHGPDHNMDHRTDHNMDHVRITNMDHGTFNRRIV